MFVAVMPPVSRKLTKLLIVVWTSAYFWAVALCAVTYAVLDGGIESALQALNTEYGDQTEMTCTPLRSFEGFAEQVLGADHDLAATPFTRVVSDDDDRLYWLAFTISYRGSCSPFWTQYTGFTMCTWGPVPYKRGGMALTYFSLSTLLFFSNALLFYECPANIALWTSLHFEQCLWSHL